MIPAQPAHSMGVPAIPIATDNGSNWLDDYLGPQSISSTRSKRWREYTFSFTHLVQCRHLRGAALEIAESLILGEPNRLALTGLPKMSLGPVAELVGIRVGVVSGVINLESSGVEASDWRLRHEAIYHEA
jgi:hypothetical protein